MDGAKRKLIIGVLVIVFSFCHLEQCKEPTSPEQTPPEEPTYYSIQLKYVRPPGSITRPDQLWKYVRVGFDAFCNHRPCYIGFLFDDMLDDYNSNWTEPQSVPDNEKSQVYYMWGIDAARWDGVHDDSAIVGDIFFIRVKETGFEKQLTNVVENYHSRNPYGGPNARMVLWRLMKDGTVRDE